MSDQVYKVKWIVKDKRLIKFYDSEDSYNIADDVNIDGVENGSSVTMEQKENIVVKMSIAKVEKKEEPKTEAKVEEKNVEQKPVEKVEEKAPVVKEEVVETLTWIISAIAFEKGVVKFEQQATEKYWYPIAPDAKKAFVGLKKGDSVQIVIAKVDAESQSGETYQKDGVVKATAIIKEEEPSKEVKTETQKTSNTSRTINDSIERQVALKGAVELVKVILPAHTDINEVAELLKFYTKACLEAMQNV